MIGISLDINVINIDLLQTDKEKKSTLNIKARNLISQQLK